jgi:ABC-type lipoprotein release transport system permease subunit
LRSQWRAWLVIAALVGVVGGFVLASAAAGRRTDAAFPAFAAAYGFDATVYASQPVPELASLPTVASVIGEVNPDNGLPTCDCAHPINASNLTVLAEPESGRPIFKLVAGSEPDPSSPNEVLASFTLEQDSGVHVGTIIEMPFFSTAQAAAANAATGSGLKPLGPTVKMRVVGIVASPFDFPSGQPPSYELYTTPAFTRAVLPHTAKGFDYAVRLVHGAADLPKFDAEANSLESSGVEGVGNLPGDFQAVEASIHPQGVGWFILALLAALVGLAVIGQALARQSNVERADYPMLMALGAMKHQLIGLAMARALVIGFVGAIGAVVIAVALSPLAPVGEARIAEASTGLSFDPVVLPLGAVATVLAVCLLAIGPSIQAARPARANRHETVNRPSSIVTHLSAIGAPPSVLIGVRNALQRRASGGAIPIGTAFLGTVLGVVALCGTAVFGASLTHLTATSALYGNGYQLTFDVIPGLPDPALLHSLERSPTITSITKVEAEQVSIDHKTVGADAITAIRGRIAFVTAQGHLPDGDGQIALGAGTMRSIRTNVGALINVSVPTPTGGQTTEPFRVVAELPLPVVGGYTGLGDGAMFTIGGYEQAACRSSALKATCRTAVEDSSFGAIATSMVPGPRGEATISHYLESDPLVAALPVTPTSLVNFGEAINFPLLFGVIVSIFGAGMLIHLLVVSVTRRRRETGLLKVLGFTNLQVVSSMSCQATTLTIVGIVVGMPIGVIVGRATWTLFARQLGVVPVAVVPVWLLGVLAAGIVVTANLLALGPAVAATRIKTQTLLQSH